MKPHLLAILFIAVGLIGSAQASESGRSWDQQGASIEYNVSPLAAQVKDANGSREGWRKAPVESWDPYYRLALMRDLQVLATTGNPPADHGPASERIPNAEKPSPEWIAALSESIMRLQMSLDGIRVDKPVVEKVLAIVQLHKVDPFASNAMCTVPGGAYGARNPPAGAPGRNTNGLVDLTAAIAWLRNGNDVPRKAPYDPLIPVDALKATTLFGGVQDKTVLCWSPAGKPPIAIRVYCNTAVDAPMLDTALAHQNATIMYTPAIDEPKWTAAEIERIATAK